MNFLFEKNNHRARIFTFGIGTESSRELCERIAREGKGMATFVYGQDRLESKVVGILKRAFQLVLENISVLEEQMFITPLKIRAVNIYFFMGYGKGFMINNI